VWHAQYVRGLRTDVVPVTLPLLGATWYRQELRRRYGLLGADFAMNWYGQAATLDAIKAGARATRRPFAAAASVDASVRNAVSPSWTLRGLVYVAGSSTVRSPPEIDLLTSEVARQLAVKGGSRTGRDPTTRYLQHLLNCPALILANAENRGAGGSLDSACNFR
ncbi:MAG: hypothetical protein ABI877_15900, partial [Gemmatimonadaceae bacterium]